MKKKNVVILIIFIILLFSGMLLSFSYIEKNKKPEKVSGIKRFEKRLEKKENMLIYVTEEKCELCKPIDKIIQFYEEAYDLDFYYTNKEDLSGSELRDYFGLADQAIELPAVIYIRDGMLKGIDNKILNEDYFRDYLMEYDFLDKAYYKNDYRLTYEEFKENSSKNEKNIVFFYNYGSNVYQIGEEKKQVQMLDRDDVRKELLKLSKEKEFTYGLVFYHSSGSDKIYQEVMGMIGKKEIEGPFIVITENGKVVDYLVPKNKDGISQFLIKNKIYES